MGEIRMVTKDTLGFVFEKGQAQGTEWPCSK